MAYYIKGVVRRLETAASRRRFDRHPTRRTVLFYLQRLCFAGRVRGRTFGMAPMRHPRINLLRIEEDLSEVHLRLSRVTIEHLDCSKFMAAYDRQGTLFYLDPPYYKAPVYNHNFKLPVMPI